MRKDAQPVRLPDSQRKAVPIPEGMISDEAVRKGLAAYAAAVHRDRFGPFTVEEIEARIESEKRRIKLMHMRFDSAL